MTCGPVSLQQLLTAAANPLAVHKALKKKQPWLPVNGRRGFVCQLGRNAQGSADLVRFIVPITNAPRP
jgi:hypothetical protein